MLWPATPIPSYDRGCRGVAPDVVPAVGVRSVDALGLAADARKRLREAADIFRSLEATPWAERADRELAACGASVPSQTTASPSAILTLQEMQVCLLVKLTVAAIAP